MLVEVNYKRIQKILNEHCPEQQVTEEESLAPEQADRLMRRTEQVVQDPQKAYRIVNLASPPTRLQTPLSQGRGVFPFSSHKQIRGTHG